MSTSMKVKVEVLKLIECVEARKAEAVAAHEVALGEYPAKVKEWKQEAHKALMKAIEQVEAGEMPTIAKDGYGRGFPPLPYLSANHSTAEYDRTLATLRMATDPTISISADDYGRYVR